MKRQMTTFFFLLISVFPFSAEAISSVSFQAMYAAASRGDVEGLRSAMHRGLKIDSVNQKGDTGVCVAIKRGDYKAYNAFIQAGARDNPPCLARIKRSKYERFIASDKIVRFPRNQYTPPAGRQAPDNYYYPDQYIAARQVNIIQRELDYTARTGNAYNLLYMPVSLLFSFFP